MLLQVSTAQYGHILMIVLLHELECTLSSYHFPMAITPLAVSPPSGQGKYAEGGWLVEEYIWGGFLSIEWPRSSRGRLDAIKRVNFEHKGILYDITGKSRAPSV